MSRMTKWIALGLLGTGLLVWTISCIQENSDPDAAPPGEPGQPTYHTHGGYWHHGYYVWPRTFYYYGGSSAPAAPHSQPGVSARGGFGSSASVHSVGA